MAKAKTNLSKRLLAALLSVVMVFSVIPFSATMALAATDEHPDAVTLTVKDEAGNFIENAEVAFTIDSQTNGDLWKSETKQTDKNGCVELLPTADFTADDLTLTATVSKEGFETNETLVDMAITSDDQNFEVVLISKMPTGITAVGRTITYDPALKDIPAVDVQGVNTDTDTVTYTMDGVDLGTEVPTVTNVKRDAGGNVVPYVITVKVEREGKELPFESGEIYTYVNPADIQVDFSANEPLPYNEEEQELVTVEGAENIPDSSKVIWYLNDQVYSESIQEVPKAKAVGEYTVRLVIDGNPNYVVFDKEETSEISATEIEGLSAQLASGLVYNGSEQELLKKDEVTGQFVSGLKDGDTVYFMVGNSAEEVENSSAWVELTADNVPVGENAGEYFVKIKVERTNYNPTEIELNPATVTISKAPTEIEFVSANDAEVSFMQTELPKKFQYTAQNKSSSTGKITYSVELADSMNGDTDINAVAEIDSNTGELTVKSNGEIVIKATLEETDNYQSATIERSLKINTTEDPNKPFIAFEDSDVDYILGENGGITRFNNAELQNNGIGIIRYSIENAEKYGLEIYSKYILVPAGYNYAVKVNDYNKLTTAINENNGSLRVKVYATKSEAFGQAEATTFYYLNISYGDTPTSTSPYTLSTVDGSNGWYRTPVTVTPAEGYTIAKTEVNEKGDNFADTIQFDDQGTNDRYVYLKDNASGAIARVKVVDANGDNLKIDTETPYDLKVEYSKPLLKKILEKITFGFYKSSVTLRFTAADDASGLAYLDWTYKREAEQSETNLETESGTKLEFNNGEAILTLTASEEKQYRGNISFTVYDKAGNSTSATDDGNVFVVDTISPTMTVEYAGAYAVAQNTIDNVHYFNGNVEVKLTVTEANFYSEGVTVSVSKDGNEFQSVSNVNWKDDSVDDHIGTFTLSGDGHYVVNVEYTDCSNNKMASYTSQLIIIDTKAPTMTVKYNGEADYEAAQNSINNVHYYNGNVTAEFTVTETNFFPEDVTVTVTKDGGTPYSVTPTWRDKSVDEHIGTYTLSGDGDYVINVEYTDRSNNQMESYQSETITIDTIKPVIDVEYQNTNLIDTVKDRDGNDRQYFDDTQTAVVTINEHNFNSKDVNFAIIAKDVTGKELDVSAWNTNPEWRTGENDDIHIITITYPGDANYTFDVDCSDLATNQSDDYAPDYFTVDKTAPTDLTVSYSTSVLDTILESLSFGFYNAKMTVTLTADDITSGVHNFKYSYLNAAGVSTVNAELIDQAIDASNIEYSKDGLTATATFEIPKMVLGNDNQFNGTVEFTAYDRADNETNQKDTKRIVVDNIAPTATVQYNTPVNEAGGISYYDGNINATVTITEANFYANDVQVMVAKDGGAPYAVMPSWTDNSVDTHTGTFTLTEDGDYIITINYRDKSTNQMQTYTSNQLTIDTDIQAPTYSINGVVKTNEGGAYKNDATVAFSFEDQNFDTKTIKLERTRFNSVEDVTDEFIRSSDTNKGGSGSFEIPSEVENDGIYVLTISMTDKANHTTESSLKFTINRYGSVYEYSDYLTELLEKQYIKIDGNNSAAITQDLVITEYNANQILTDSLNILITRDGEAIDTQYTSNPTVDGNAGIGESGWYQYEYTIAKENFAEDGVYKITLTSAYAADDSDRNESTSVPENSMDAAGNQILNTMDFTVDTTKPEIRNIVNLDKPIVNAQTLEVAYTIVDVGGLKSIEIIVNGSTIDTITEFGDNAFNYSGNFTLNESSAAQTVQIKVTDMAGNVTDTASDDFSTNDLYIFNDTITVSTNFFVRWYANQPLFWGSIGGVVVLAGVIWFLIAFKRRKKDDKEAN